MNSQPNKKLKTDTDVDEVDAREVILFHFSGASEGVQPEFVHQNFGERGVIAWPRAFMPLSVRIHVDTASSLEAFIEVNHGGTVDDPELRDYLADLLFRIATPCDLGNGCKPAVYPGDLTKRQPSSSSVDEVAPTSVEEVGGGLSVARFRSKEFQGRSLEVWRRAEWLMLWFIEGVSQSGHDTDPNWEYFFLKNPSGHILATSSVYRYPSFSFLSSGFIGDRYRLSQFLTIPSGWNAGFGSSLLRYLVDSVLSREDVDKLTMEDPSFGMTSLRESVYLRIAKEQGLLLKDPEYEELEQELKIPRVFAKRIKCLLEMNKIKGKKSVDERVIDSVINSGNHYVKKFIDSIEFYADNEDEGAVQQTGLSEEESAQLIREKVEEALLKLEKLGA